MRFDAETLSIDQSEVSDTNRSCLMLFDAETGEVGETP